MQTPITGWQFVEIGKPGEQYQNAFAIRSHLRRLVARQKSANAKSPGHKFIQQDPTAKRIRPGRKTTSAINQRHKNYRGWSMPCTECDSHTRSCFSYSAFAREMMVGSEHAIATIPKNPACRHPFVALASSHVNLTESRLDQLFKSDAFKYAAEPLFDTSHIDSELNILEVFPTCINDVVFYNSLVYAILQSYNRGVPSQEVYRLKSQSIACLQKSLAGSDPSVASILCLRGAAYKWEDLATYEIHSLGLKKVLEAYQLHLTPAARRALFWQDLFASELVKAPRKLSHDSLPDKIFWTRTTAGPANRLPQGFRKHQGLLPGSLTDCIIDCLELQATVMNPPGSVRERYITLDTKQANLESRLASQTLICEAFSIIAAAVRVAVFIICYTTWMDTWNCPLIPTRLAEQLLKLLEPSLMLSDKESNYEGEIWHNRRDIQLWALLVGAGVSKGNVHGRYRNAIVAFAYASATTQRGPEAMQSCWKDHDDLSKILHAAIGDFLRPVCGDVVSCMDRWFKAETVLNMRLCPDG